MRQHVWWTYRFADPSLFPSDLAADYFSRFTFAPPGYQLLARAFVPFVDAQVFSEILPFLLTGLVALFADRIVWPIVGMALSGSDIQSIYASIGAITQTFVDDLGLYAVRYLGLTIMIAAFIAGSPP